VFFNYDKNKITSHKYTDELLSTIFVHLSTNTFSNWHERHSAVNNAEIRDGSINRNIYRYVSISIQKKYRIAQRFYK